jgi:hypothetical protein
MVERNTVPSLPAGKRSDHRRFPAIPPDLGTRTCLVPKQIGALRPTPERPEADGVDSMKARDGLAELRSPTLRRRLPGTYPSVLRLLAGAQMTI